jgi:hypothetical protein
LIASTRQLLSLVISLLKQLYWISETILECAYSFNESIDACLTSFVACAGVMPITQSTPQTTKQRLRAIRLTGSPPLVDGSDAVKNRA